MEIISSERASLTSGGAPSKGKQLGGQLQAEHLQETLRPQTCPDSPPYCLTWYILSQISICHLDLKSLRRMKDSPTFSQASHFPWRPQQGRPQSTWDAFNDEEGLM